MKGNSVKENNQTKPIIICENNYYYIHYELLYLSIPPSVTLHVLGAQK